MIRGAIIICLVNYCALLFSQDLHLSRNFEARRKSIPVEILNNHPSHFYVLRLNNVVHDITVERRAKPSAEILAFTPLKLDSVNADWFDYGNLDYLFFEEGSHVFFVFEKVRNSKKTVYLKIIDSLGKSGGFIELATMERDNSSFDMEFVVKRTSDNNILVVGSRYGVNGITRRTATLFDIHTRRIAWVKKLPLDRSATEFSGSYECSREKDLFYMRTRSSIVAYETVYRNNIRYDEPILKLDSIFVCKWEHGSEYPVKAGIDANGITNLKNATVLLKDSTVLLSLQGYNEYISEDSVEALFVNVKLKLPDLEEIYTKATPYSYLIKKQLTFYDSPQKEYYHKQHRLINSYPAGQSLYAVAERTEGYYYKELLLWKTDLANGDVPFQKIIPRKIFFFKNRTRFKNIGKVMTAAFKDSLSVMVLESPGNFKKDADVYDYRAFRKETKLYNSNLVAYSLQKDGRLRKKLIYRNSDFDLVPLKYESLGQKDAVFYLNNSKFERFAILQLYP